MEEAEVVMEVKWVTLVEVEFGRGRVYCQGGGEDVSGEQVGGHAGILRCWQREKWDGW